MFCFLVDQKILTYVSSVFQVNSILFVFLLQRISRVSKFRDRMTRTQHVRAWLRRSSVLLPVLGITWSFGFLTFISSTTVFHYLFTGFNTLQGFIIFVNFCVIDTEVSLSFIPLLNCCSSYKFNKELRTQKLDGPKFTQEEDGI